MVIKWGYSTSFFSMLTFKTDGEKLTKDEH